MPAINILLSIKSINTSEQHILKAHREICFDHQYSFPVGIPPSIQWKMIINCYKSVCLQLHNPISEVLFNTGRFYSFYYFNLACYGRVKIKSIHQK